MINRPTKHGNRLALVIEGRFLDLRELDADTPLSLTNDGKCLLVAPVRDAKRRAAFRKALAEGNRKYGRMLRRLAD